MISKTRNLVLASLLVVCAGLGIGLFAYVTRSTSALAAPGPGELRFLPGDADVVAFANVQDVMASPLRQRIRDGLRADGSQAFQAGTGINPETDIDRIVLGSMPPQGDGSPAPRPSLVVVRGRFDAARIERTMRDRGGRVDEYKGTRIVTAPTRPATTTPEATATPARGPMALAFLESGLIAVGDTEGVRRAIDVGRDGRNVLTNTDLINRVRTLDGNSLWAVGRFDALPNQSPMTAGIAGQLPPMTWFAASGQIDAGVKAQFTAETRDEASADGLRDMIRGFMAIGRMQAGSRPEMQPLLQSVQIGGAGRTVTLSLDLSPQMLDLLSRGLQPPAIRPEVPPR
jgi:hypothetical protein